MAEVDSADAFGVLSAQLKSYGLGELFSVDRNGKPGGWLWEQVQSGVDTPNELMARLEQTSVFRERFGVIVEQQRRAAAGEPIVVMSPNEVMEYERRATQAMSKAGMPKWFYDQPDDFAKLMLKDMSIAEVEQRVVEAYDYVKAAPPEVKAAFNELYGTQGDGALAAWALDPERTLRDINKATRTAYASGISERFDVKVQRETATRIAELQMSDQEVKARFENVARMKGLMTESLGEATDITTDDGVSSVFESDAAAEAKFSRRVGERQSMNRATTGGAAITNEGVVGAGTS